jgi:outer membrane protein OmpA-like peptidoglycan-associated protein
MRFGSTASAGFLVLALGGVPNLWAQGNLIPNPGFEAFLKCPGNLGNFQADVSDWSCPTQGSTDYFHRCSEQMGSPSNFNGRQEPLEGDGYAGMYVYAPGDYREYISTRLKQPLRKGVRYELSFYVSLSERSDFAIREFGVLFSSAPLSVPIKKNLSKKHWYAREGLTFHFLKAGSQDYLGDTREWVRLSVDFEALGSERYLVLGNFNTNRETPKRKTGRSSNKGAYYYVDQVELSSPGGEEVLAGPTGEPGTEGGFSLDSLQAFRSVLFEFDTYRLSQPGKEELQSLFRFLSANPDLHLFLGGHTDAMGTAAYNQSLSDLRCRAVVAYLEELGLDGQRVRWEGFGASRPVAGNDTEAGRQANRRVEFLIRQKRLAPEGG